MTRPFAPGERIPPDLLLKAYASGVFPMAESADDPEVFWVRPETRGVIPLDASRGRSTPGARKYLGDAHGWWEGDTLVVETTNFLPETAPQGSTENVKMTERFTAMSPGVVEWRATFEDANTWTRPWTLQFPWKREPVYGMFEYACHEGNYAMRNILSISRAAERAGK